MSYRKYLQTLRRLPDEVVLDMATREFTMSRADFCLCGWAMRAALSQANGKTPEEFDDFGFPSDMAERFGGTEDEWRAIYLGVTPQWSDLIVGGLEWAENQLRGKLATIEEAFVHRVIEAAG